MELSLSLMMMMMMMMMMMVDVSGGIALISEGNIVHGFEASYSRSHLFV